MPPPTSILLPTTAPSPAVEEIARQLGPANELLVVCDRASDPVAGRVDDLTSARLVVAGEPAGCSGKANAVVAGMEAATHDRVVWTDDDFRHPPDWLAGLHEAYERFGPVSEHPFFVGTDPLSLLLEPVYALGAHASDKAWGGAVMFECGDLDVDPFLHDLRRTVNDDGLLSERLDVTSLERVPRVEIGGTIRETLERHVRFTQIVHRHDPRDTAFIAVVTIALALWCPLSPLVAGAVVTSFAPACTRGSAFGAGRFGAGRRCSPIRPYSSRCRSRRTRSAAAPSCGGAALPLARQVRRRGRRRRRVRGRRPRSRVAPADPSERPQGRL